MALAVLTSRPVLGAVVSVAVSGLSWLASTIFGKKTSQFKECKCNKAAQLKVSITPNDFGRRYMCCFYHEEENDCRYFEWIDPQIDDRIKDVINGFIKNVQSLESENESLKSSNKEQQEKIKTLESTVDGLKLGLAIEKSSLQLTSRSLYSSLATNMLLILGIIAIPYFSCYTYGYYKLPVEIFLDGQNQVIVHLFSLKCS